MKHSLVLTLCLIAISLVSPTAFAEKHKWNNPENEQRYKDALKRESEARKQEAKAWNNYDRELGRAQDDVRRVRNEAIKGAVTGGAPGAVAGAGKGAAKGIADRVKNRKQNKD